MLQSKLKKKMIFWKNIKKCSPECIEEKQVLKEDHLQCRVSIVWWSHGWVESEVSWSQHTPDLLTNWRLSWSWEAGRWWQWHFYSPHVFNNCNQDESFYQRFTCSEPTLSHHCLNYLQHKSWDQQYIIYYFWPSMNLRAEGKWLSISEDSSSVMLMWKKF